MYLIYLQRPLEIINLSQDSDILNIHTYEGAKYGKIIHSLIKHKILFDEVDKSAKPLSRN